MTGLGRARLQDVADAAGVSLATASKALNGRTEVALETRLRVTRIAQELDYLVDATARSLASGSSRTVGVLTSDRVGRFSTPVLFGAERALGDGSMAVMLWDAAGQPVREAQHLRMLAARGVDGLLVVGETSNPRPPIGLPSGVPIVYAYAPSQNPNDVSVVTDDFAGAVLATDHLLSIGRHRIAHVTGPSSFQAVVDRAAGMRSVLDGAGLRMVLDEPLFGAWSQRWGRLAAERLLSQAVEVDAIFCGSDQIAAGVLDTLRDRGVRCPDDISVVGFDNWDIFALETRPALTSIDMGLPSLGARAAWHLLEAIAGRPHPGVHTTAPRLLIRDSTGPAPSRRARTERMEPAQLTEGAR